MSMNNLEAADITTMIQQSGIRVIDPNVMAEIFHEVAKEEGLSPPPVEKLSSFYEFVSEQTKLLATGIISYNEFVEIIQPHYEQLFEVVKTGYAYKPH